MGTVFQCPLTTALRRFSICEVPMHAASNHPREGADQTKQERYANGELALTFLASG
jgi:hypothetical protein